jgi:hypothetical protein
MCAPVEPPEVAHRPSGHLMDGRSRRSITTSIIYFGLNHARIRLELSHQPSRRSRFTVIRAAPRWRWYHSSRNHRRSPPPNSPSLHHGRM